MLKLTIITSERPHWHSFFVILEHTFSSVSVADVEQVNVSLTGHAFYLPPSLAPCYQRFSNVFRGYKNRPVT